MERGAQRQRPRVAYRWELGEAFKSSEMFNKGRRDGTAGRHFSGYLRGVVPSLWVDVNDLETSKSGVAVRLNEMDVGSSALRNWMKWKVSWTQPYSLQFTHLIQENYHNCK